jgi:hypothetical protein
MRLSFNDKESFMEAAESLHFNNPPSDPNAFQQLGRSGSVPPQERSEDICFDNPSESNDPNILQQMGSSSSMPSQERSEDICFDNPSNDPNTLQRMGSSSTQKRSEDI